MLPENAKLDHDDECATAISPCNRFIKYDVVIGSGSFKTVYRGLDTDTGVTVAWCELIGKKVSKAERKRFREEADLLKNLQHPNIVGFYTYWESTVDKRKNIVLVTELMYSGTLKSYLRRFGKKINPKIIKSYSRQILKGLSFLHSRTPPIIHRDLKCDNIFIAGNTGSVKIGDLGLATLKNRSYAKSVIGTPEFMAPEMYQEEYDEAVDVYAFGMCIIEMITLEYPYIECTTPAQIYKRVVNGTKPDGFAQIENVDLKEVVEKCIELNKENRPSAKELLSSDLLSEDIGIKLEPMLKCGFLTDTTCTSIRFQLRLDPKKRRHKQNEAIQFDFDITLDNAPDVASDLFKDNFVSEDDSRIVSDLLKGQVQSLIKMRRELSLKQLELNREQSIADEAKAMTAQTVRPTQLLVDTQQRPLTQAPPTNKLQHDLENILRTRSITHIASTAVAGNSAVVPALQYPTACDSSKVNSPLKSVPSFALSKQQQELEQQLVQVLQPLMQQEPRQFDGEQLPVSESNGPTGVCKTTRFDVKPVVQVANFVVSFLYVALLFVICNNMFVVLSTSTHLCRMCCTRNVNC